MRIASFRKNFVVGLSLVLIEIANDLSAGLTLPPPSSLQMFTTFAWEASPSPEVAGYAIYYQVTNSPVTHRVDAGKSLSVTIPLVVGAAHSFHAVAYTADGVESGPSNSLEYTPPPMTPIRLSRMPDGSMQLSFRTSPLTFCWVEWTPSLERPDWQPLTLGWLVADPLGNVVVQDFAVQHATARFYRAVKY